MDVFYLFLENFKCNTKRELEYKAGRFLVEFAAKNFFHLQNSELEIIKNKPKFKYSDLHFSISHSKNIAAACFDKNPVGFDIEFVKNRDFIPIAERMNFCLKENTLEEFYKCWTKYEAEYKLQIKAESCITEMLFDKYIISVVSNKKQNIILNYHEILQPLISI